MKFFACHVEENCPIWQAILFCIVCIIMFSAVGERERKKYHVWVQTDRIPITLTKRRLMMIILDISQLRHPRRWCTFFKPAYFFPQGTRKGLLWIKNTPTKTPSYLRCFVARQFLSCGSSLSANDTYIRLRSCNHQHSSEPLKHLEYTS